MRQFVALIADRFGVADAVLYGGRARSSHQPDSDADLAVLLSGPRLRLLPTTMAMADLAFGVLLETGINISPLPLWLDEWEHPGSHSNQELLRNIARDGIRL